MQKGILAGLIVAAAVLIGGAAVAENLVLSGNDRWVAVASRQDLNEAISIAKTYAAQKSRVVKAQNGWFAVVLGPYATGDIASFRSSYGGPALPRDAMLAVGTSYVETVWEPSSETPVAAADADQINWSELSERVSADCQKAGEQPSTPGWDLCINSLAQKELNNRQAAIDAVAQKEINDRERTKRVLRAIGRGLTAIGNAYDKQAADAAAANAAAANAANARAAQYFRCTSTLNGTLVTTICQPN